MKRIFDVIVAAAGLIVLAPLFVVAALVVKCDSRGPVFFRATRIGRGGRPFQLHKFRTMIHGVKGPRVTTARDPRITRSGRFLRAARIDELPQLFNVLLGEMSLVGPRPEDPRFVRAGDPVWQRVLSVRPGITGSAQLVHADRERELLNDDRPERDYLERVLPAKLRVDLAYVDERTFAGDLGLIVRTFRRVLGRQP